MSEVRFSSGAASVSMNADIGRKLLERLQKGIPAQLLHEAEQVAADARATWYGPQGVRRITGQSGDIRATAIISETDVQIRVGSADTRKDKRGRPAVAFVRRPGALSLSPVEIDKATYLAGKKGAKPDSFFHAKKDSPPLVKAGLFYELKSNPLAGDGKFLFQVFVRAPFNSRMKAAIARISKEIVNGR